MKHASKLRGFLVIARQEGEQLGSLSTIYIDPDKKRASAIGYRTKRLGGDQYFVPIDEVEILGKDVILISSQQAAREVSEAMKLPGRSLKDLQGAWVTTQEGHHLGTLVDLDLSSDWLVSQLILADDQQLVVEPDQIIIGKDIILVPGSYSERLKQTEEAGSGFLSRTFGGEALEDTKKLLKRALRREEKPSQSSDETEHNT